MSKFRIYSLSTRYRAFSLLFFPFGWRSSTISVEKFQVEAQDPFPKGNLVLFLLVNSTRKPSYRWQTRTTRKPAKIAPIRRAYNVVVDNTGLSSCV